MKNPIDVILTHPELNKAGIHDFNLRFRAYTVLEDIGDHFRQIKTAVERAKLPRDKRVESLDLLERLEEQERSKLLSNPVQYLKLWDEMPMGGYAARFRLRRKVKSRKRRND